MPVPQLTPPGHLDQHSLVVALTPALLCLAMAGAAWLIGRDGRALRVLAGINLVAALLLQALFLVPWGPAAAYTEPIGGGVVRVGWSETGAAFLLGCWALWYWRPWRPTVTGGVVRWCQRVALALALPTLALPLLAIPALADVRTDAIQPDHGRRCWKAGVIALLATAAILTWPGLPPRQMWWFHGSALLTCGVLLGRGPWMLPLIIAGMATVHSWGNLLP